MQGTVRIGNNSYQVNYDVPIDLSLPLNPGDPTPNCFFAPPVSASPVRSGDFVGSIREGSPVNFFNLQVNPHGNGTHTECVGHIAEGNYSIHKSLKEFVFPAQVISVLPQKVSGDRVITLENLRNAWNPLDQMQALVIRTLPNHQDKRHRIYSGTNPPYLEEKAMNLISQSEIQHLLIDLPSVDKEEDGGRLNAHKSFFKFQGDIRTDRTISELIFVPDQVEDGVYLLHLYVLNLNLDASPSRPVLYQLKK